MRSSIFKTTGAAIGLLAVALAGCSGGGGNGATPPGRATVVGCYYEACLPSPAATTNGGGATATPSGSGATSTPSGGGATSTPSGGGATSTPSGSGATSTPVASSAPSAAPSTSPSTAPSSTIGTLTLDPTLLVPIGVLNAATATTVATQAGYTGAFTPTISCPLSTLPSGALTAAANGATITVTENENLVPVLGADVYCTLTVAGGGGQTATAMVLLATSVVPGTPATPAPQTPGGAPGALTVTPSLLFPVGVLTPGATEGAITQINYLGPYTAAVTCSVALPTGAVTATVTGSTVTVTENSSLLTGVAGANLLCTLTVTGGGGMTGTANVLLGANAAS